MPLSRSFKANGAGRPDKVLGHTIARRFTPPIAVGRPGPCGCGCALTPENSYGFAVDQFAREILRAPLDPWQRWVAIHAGEMIRDANGFWRPRFRRLILLVARQNGKTHLLKVLALFWMAVQAIPRILGTSNKLEHAFEAMEEAHTMALEAPDLEDLLPRGSARGLTRDNNKPRMRMTNGSRYKAAAATGNAGRSMTLNRWICDETLKQTDWETYKSANYAMRAVRDAQAWFIGSQGDDRSVLLNSLHAQALPYAEGKKADPDGEAVGLFEYSALEDAATDDPEALAMANPNMNHETEHGVFGLEAEAKAAMEDPSAEAGFRTESMCIRVKNLDPAVDPKRWEECGTDDFKMPDERRVYCLDVSLDGRHATLAGARMAPTGKSQVAVVKAWEGWDAMKQLQVELPQLLLDLKARTLGYFPNGPAASVAVSLNRRGRGAMPTTVKVEEITSEMADVCMGFAERVIAGEIVHNNKPLLNMHVTAAGKKKTADRWIFQRATESYVDAAYAAAGAVHLARKQPPPAMTTSLITKRR